MRRMMNLALALAIGFGGVVTTACGELNNEREPAATNQQQDSEDNSDPGDVDEAEHQDKPEEPDEPVMSDELPPVDYFVGRTYQEARDEINAAVNPQSVRVYNAGGPITDDYVIGRLNVGVDEQDRVVTLWFDCGPWRNLAEDEFGQSESGEEEEADQLAEEMLEQFIERPSSDVPPREHFSGRVLDNEVKQELTDALNPTVFRVYRVGDALTRDYAWGRLNIGLDEEGRIVTLWFDNFGWERQSWD